MTKKVITYGTFDLFHVGHVRLFRRLSELGDHLTVGVSTDEFNASKGKASVVPFEQRVEIVQSCRYVDEVLLEESWDQKPKDIVAHNISVFAMGDDWAGKFDDLSKLCEVVYLPRTTDISSSFLKSYVKNEHDERVSQIERNASKLIKGNE
ncbi:adenylyltransferase/cytidyltransferase family protein [Celeribacter sp.]|uniref:adenylyltransferase/cytidyltransferase family protein n=1 Tax=Celeribacter sp. TaxID=1890673 RepID=UPI003A8F14D8